MTGFYTNRYPIEKQIPYWGLDFSFVIRLIAVSLEVNCGNIAHNICVCDGLLKTKEQIRNEVTYQSIVNYRFT